MLERMRVAVTAAVAVAILGAAAEAEAATALIDVVVVAPGGSEGSVATEVRARILHHARALCAVTSPTVNCYKRLQIGQGRGGIPSAGQDDFAAHGL